MKNKYLFISTLLFFTILCFSQENEKANLPKGKVYSNPLVDVAKHYITESNVVEINSNKWRAKDNYLFNTGSYQANTSYKHQSLTIKLPEITNKNERINLYLTEEFELESYYDEGKVLVSSDKGATWKTVSIRSGKRGTGTSIVNLTKFAGEKVIIAFELKSDGSNNYAGWTVKNAAIKKDVVVGSPSALKATPSLGLKADNRATLTGDFSNLDASLFPMEVVLTCEIKENGTALSTLDSSNFTVYEKIDSLWVYDTTWVQDSLYVDYRNSLNAPLGFTVKKPGSTTLDKYADIVFLMDNSGSMGDDQEAVENNVVSFVKALGDKGIKAQLGLTRFGQGANNGIAEVVKNGAGSWWNNYGNTNYDTTAFLNMWRNVNTADGGTERSYDALMDAQVTGNYIFAPGAQRIFILITDESMTNNNAQYSTHTDSIVVINQMNARNITVYSLGLDREPDRSDYETVARATGGRFYNIRNSFNTILDDIVAQVSGKYEIHYPPTRQVFDGLTRELEIEVTHNGNTLLLTGQEYTPGEAPKIELTQQTLDILHSGIPFEEDSTAPVQICVYDYSEPRPHDGGPDRYVKLYYNSVIDTTDTYYELNMTCDSIFGVGDTTIWSVNIPGNKVKYPGIRYYIVASDSITATPSPLQNTQYMWTFAIWPNYAPQLADSTNYADAATADSIVKEGYNIGDIVTFRLHVFDTTVSINHVAMYISSPTNIQFDPKPMTLVGNDIYECTDTLKGGNTRYFFMATDNYGVSSMLGTEFNPYVIKTEIVNPNYRHDINLAGGPPPPFWNAVKKWLGEDLVAGDSIKVYTADLFSEKCVMTVPYDTKSFRINGDDPNIAGKDGFFLHDQIIFKVYKARTGKIYDAEVVYKPGCDITFQDNGKSNIDSLMVYGQISTLTENDNWWSTYAQLGNTSFDIVFDDISNNIDIVKDHLGNTWVPGQPSNTLTNYVRGYGYEVYLKSNTWPLEVISIGKQRDYAQEKPEIRVYPDVTLIGCPYSSGENLENIANANSEIGAITKLTGGTYYSYYPQYMSSNTWTGDCNIYPGKAYQVCTYGTSAFNLTYPSPSGLKSSTSVAKNTNVKTYPQRPRSGDAFMHLLLPEGSWSTPPVNGDMVKVYTLSGELIGQNYVFNNGTSMLIDGLDLNIGETFEIRYEKAETGEQTTIVVENWEHGDATYEANKLAVAGSLKRQTGATMKSGISNLTIYPVPARNNVNITLTLSSNSVLEVFLSDVSGTKVYSISGKEYTKGVHAINIPADYGSGMYTLTVTDDKGNSMNKKVIID